jgi:hypothetical protein
MIAMKTIVGHSGTMKGIALGGLLFAALSIAGTPAQGADHIRPYEANPFYYLGPGAPARVVLHEQRDGRACRVGGLLGEVRPPKGGSRGRGNLRHRHAQKRECAEQRPRAHLRPSGAVHLCGYLAEQRLGRPRPGEHLIRYYGTDRGDRETAMREAHVHSGETDWQGLGRAPPPPRTGPKRAKQPLREPKLCSL